MNLVQDSSAVAFARAIAAHRVLVAAIALLALLGGLAAVALRSPVYEASAEVLLKPVVRDDPTFIGLDVLREAGANDATRTAQTAAEVLRSRTAAVATARKLGSGFTGDDVLDSVTIEAIGESNVLGVTALADEARKSARLATTYAQSVLAERAARLSEQIDSRIGQLQETSRSAEPDSELASSLAQEIARLQGIRALGTDPSLELSEPAEVPREANGRAPALVLVITLLAGIALGAVVAVAIELFNRRIRDVDDVLRAWPLPVLATVPRTVRHLTFSADGAPELPGSVREAYRTLGVQLERGLPSTQTVMLTSASTGDGKTSVASGLAMALVDAGHSVVVLDFDLRHPGIGASLGTSESSNGRLAANLFAGNGVSDLLVDSPYSTSLRMLLGVQTANGSFPGLSRRLPRIIEEVRGMAEFVVIDTGALGEVSDALPIAEQVDELIIVARPGHTDRRNFALMRDLIERTGVPPTGLVVIGERRPVAYNAPAAVPASMVDMR